MARARACLAVQALVQFQNFRDLVADHIQRVQRRHRLLEDHRNVAAAQALHLTLALGEHVLALEANFAIVGRGGHELQYRQRGDRLARPGFADETELLAGGDGERDAVDHPRRAEVDAKAVYREQRVTN